MLDQKKSTCIAWCWIAAVIFGGIGCFHSSKPPARPLFSDEIENTEERPGPRWHPNRVLRDRADNVAFVDQTLNFIVLFKSGDGFLVKDVWPKETTANSATFELQDAQIEAVVASRNTIVLVTKDGRYSKPLPAGFATRLYEECITIDADPGRSIPQYLSQAGIETQ